jgi:hypothetical protein
LSISVGIIIAILMAFSYFVTPVTLIWGWTRWARQPKRKTFPETLSLIGFIFGTASAVLAIASIAYAQLHHFAFYDPLLLRIFRWGGLLSLGGILFGLSGVGRPGPLRWHAPACGLGMLAFWLLSAEGE